VPFSPAHGAVRGSLVWEHRHQHPTKRVKHLIQPGRPTGQAHMTTIPSLLRNMGIFPPVPTASPGWPTPNQPHRSDPHRKPVTIVAESVDPHPQRSIGFSLVLWSSAVLKDPARRRCSNIQSTNEAFRAFRALSHPLAVLCLPQVSTLWRKGHRQPTQRSPCCRPQRATQDRLRSLASAVAAP
jgi:hypothetical protein